MARPVDYRKGRGSKGVHTQDEQVPIGKKAQARNSDANARKMLRRLSTCSLRRPRGNIQQAMPAKNPNFGTNRVEDSSDLQELVTCKLARSPIGMSSHAHSFHLAMSCAMAVSAGYLHRRNDPIRV